MAKVNDELVKAVTEGDVLQVLLSELSGECDINGLYMFKSKKGYDWKATPLVVAASLGHTELVQSLIDRADIQLNAVDEDDKTALIVASEEGKLEVVKQLLAKPDTDVNHQGDYKETALYKAAEKGKLNVVRVLLEHPGVEVHLANEGDMTPLMAAAESGHVNTLSLFLNRTEDDIALKQPALYSACANGKQNVVEMLLQRDDMDVNYRNNEGDTPLIAAAEDGNIDNVRMLLSRPEILPNAQGSQKQTALIRAAQCGYVEVVELLLEFGVDSSIVDEDGLNALDIALQSEEYSTAVSLLNSGMCASKLTHEDKLLIELLAPHLTHKVAVALLRQDFPIRLDNDGAVVAVEDHLYSWTTFLDSHVPIETSLRVEVAETLVASSNDDWVRELAYAKDQHGRAALQTTDAATREFLNGLLFFCGRYEIFDGPAIHVSSTAVVVNAYDHGVFLQVFREHADEAGFLDKKAFQACGRVLGQQAQSTTASDHRKKPDVENDFELWDKDNSGHLSEAEYLRYCDQLYGGKLKVAMKFMRNADEHEREVETRHGLDIQFVLGLLPMLPQATFKSNVANLKLHGNTVEMAEYPHVLVMPAADRSLEDIFLKERPNDNQIRSMLHEVAEALNHLHSHDIVHGDLKKLNVLRVNHHMRVIDMDAATSIGKPIGAKFSSGSLPPEMFYKLKSDTEVHAHHTHWQHVVSSNPDLWKKVEPKEGWVVKSFHEDGSDLPYKLVKASPALDVWAFGALMYQMYSGVELVPTDINQDVDETGIIRAATWTKDDLRNRVQNKVSNALARELILKLLTIEPDDRMSVSSILNHAYFQIKYDDSAALVIEKLDGLKDQVATGFQDMHTRFDEVVELSRENLKAIGAAKQDLMRGIFEATEVAFPTSFVILPFNLAEPQHDDPEDLLTDLSSFFNKGIEMGHSFMSAVKHNKVIGRALRLVAPGEPLFLYLIDEVNGLPVIPPLQPGQPRPLYPIRIETKSEEYTQFMSAAMPYVQAGFRMLKGVNTIANFVQCLGMPNLDPDFLDGIGRQIDDAKKTSSVFDFDVVQSAVETETGVPVQHIRGAALRELERFFNQFDQDKDFAGLCRTYAANGQALWTTKHTIEKIEADRPPSTQALKASHEAQTQHKGQGRTAQQIYIDLLQKNDIPVALAPSENKQLTVDGDDEVTNQRLPSKDDSFKSPCCSLM